MDIRQSSSWGKYLIAINWKVEKLGLRQQAFIKNIPLIKRSVIKIQHPQNPLPLKKIDSLAQKHRALFVEIEPEAKGFNEEIFLNHGYQKSSISLTHTATIHLDLKKSKEELWSSFSENARRNIKKAQKNKLEVQQVFLKEAKDDREFKKFYALLFNLTKLKKFYIPGYNEFYRKMLAFKKNSILLFAYQKEDPEPIAAVWLGILEDTIIYMNTGITEDGYQLLANYLLVWEALKLSKSLKLKLFDFEGIYDPRFPKYRRSWKKFSEFKSRFHGKVIEYPAPLIKFYSRSFKIFFLCNRIFG